MEQIPNFPKNLAFNLRKLSGAVVKSKISLNADKSSYTPNERMVFNFPIGRMIDTRSIVLTARCQAATGNHFPRGGLNSMIQNLQISVNSRIIQSTQDYNYIWNTLADVSGYFSAEQQAKRLYENFDPSVAHTNVDGVASPATTNACTTTTGTDDYYFCVNNWLGFFSSSAPTINTNDIGALQLTITLAPNTAMWLGAPSATANTTTIGNYTVSDVTLSMDTITIQNSLYADLVKSQLEAGGLNVAYNDYLIATANNFTKSATATLTHTAQFSTNSLDLVMATFRPSNFSTPATLMLGNATISDTLADNRGATFTYNEVATSNVALEGTHGGFNQCRYFQRAGGGIRASSWYVNSQPMTVNSSAIQIFNSTLQALDYANLDIASGGFHAGAITTGFYNKNYFVDCLSLENLSGDNNNWYGTGLAGNGGVLSIQYNANFSGASVESTVIPYIIARVTKVLNIKIGRNLDIIE